MKIFTNPLDPFFALEHVYKMLQEVIINATASGRKHFRNDSIKKIAQKMEGHKNKLKDLCQNWNDVVQKKQFINILKNRVHLYIHFLRLIIRYCASKLFFLFLKDHSNFTQLSNFFSLCYLVHSIRKKIYLFDDISNISQLVFF